MRRSILVGTWAACAVAGLRSAQADGPSTLRVETEYLEYARWAKERRREDPTDRVAQQPPQPLAVSTVAPKDVRAVPEGASVFATLRAGNRDVRLALAPGAGAEATVAVDRNGDGDLTQAGETFALTAAEAGNGSSFWWVPACSLGAEGADGTLCKVGITFWKMPQTYWIAQASPGGAAAQGPSDLSLVPAPPAGAKGPGLPGTTVFTTVRPKATDVLVAFVAKDDALTVVFDANGNRDLSDDGAGVAATSEQRAEAKRAWVAKDVPVDGGRVTLTLQEKVQVRYTCQAAPSGARRGTVRIGDVPHALHLVDRDLDGAWTSGADRWWFGPVSECGRIRELNPTSMVEGDEPVFTSQGGTTVAWRIASVEPDGAVTLARDPDSGGREAYFARRSERVRKEWFAAFDKEAPEFRKAQGIDPSRPVATEPAHWLHDVDLAAGLAEAAAAGKPVLVDFEADWCQWCYRFEYYLYRDAEVADLLERFVLVKVNYEFHTAGEFERLKAPRSLPVLLVLDAKGDPVTFPLAGPDGKSEETFRIARFLPPDALAVALRSALDAWRAKAGTPAASKLR